jgi:hypothetical protein
MQRYKPFLTLMTVFAITLSLWNAGCAQDTPPGPVPPENGPSGEGPENTEPAKPTLKDAIQIDLSKQQVFELPPRNLPVIIPGVWIIRVFDSETPDLQLVGGDENITQSAERSVLDVRRISPDALDETAEPGIYFQVWAQASLLPGFYKEHFVLETNSAKNPISKVNVVAGVNPFLGVKTFTYYHKRPAENQEVQQVVGIIEKFLSPALNMPFEVKDVMDVESGVFKEWKADMALLGVKDTSFFHYLILRGEVNGQPINKIVVGSEAVLKTVQILGQYVERAASGAHTHGPEDPYPGDGCSRSKFHRGGLPDRQDQDRPGRQSWRFCRDR